MMSLPSGRVSGGLDVAVSTPELVSMSGSVLSLNHTDVFVLLLSTSFLCPMCDGCVAGFSSPGDVSVSKKRPAGKRDLVTAWPRSGLR